MGFGDLIDDADGSVRQAAAELYVQCFPLFLMDAVRRAHPMALSQFHLVGADSARLAPGLLEDDPRIILSSAWIDLSDGPVLVRLPHMHGRHFSLNIMDSAGQCLASMGSRTGDDDGLELVLAGPRWVGEVRRGLMARRSSSDMCWAISRIHAHSMLDRADAIAVARRQGLSRLQPEALQLEAADTVLDGLPSSCLREVLEVHPDQFFRRLGAILNRAPVALHGREREPMARLRRWIGSPPSSEWSSEVETELARGFADGAAAIEAAASTAYSEHGPGWHALADVPEPDAEAPLIRAARAFESLGAPPREDVMTLVCTHDDTGRLLSGSNAYRIRLPEAAMPPVNGFWRLYARPAAGPQYRTGIGSRNDLLLNSDGSLDLTIQHPLPEATGISNWLPAPEGELSLVMCLHSPRPAALKGRWRMPAVERMDPDHRQGRGVRRARTRTSRRNFSDLGMPAPAERNVP